VECRGVLNEGAVRAGETRTARGVLVQLKICTLGAFAVGKSSLVARYVHAIVSDAYHQAGHGFFWLPAAPAPTAVPQ
jgi:GTPase SAR1 family protein